MIDIRCPQCSSVWKLDDSYAGTQGHCPRCRFILDIPSSTEANTSAGIPSPEVRPQAPAKQIMVWCPECRTLLMVDSAFAGIKGMCPKCRSVLMVPEEEAPAPPAFPLDLTLPPPGSPPPPEPEVEDPGYEVVDEPPPVTKLEAITDVDEIKLVEIEDEPEEIETLELSEEDLPFVEPVAKPVPQKISPPEEMPIPKRGKEQEIVRDRRRRKRRIPPIYHEPGENSWFNFGISIGFLESAFSDTNFVILILFGFLCSPCAFPLSILAIFCTQDSTAKRNALIVTAVSGFFCCLGPSIAGLIRGR